MIEKYGDNSREFSPAAKASGPITTCCCDETFMSVTAVVIDNAWLMD